MQRIPIDHPDIKVDPVIANQLELDKYVREQERLKRALKNQKKTVQRSHNMFDGGKSDAGTAVGDSPQQMRADEQVADAKGDGTYGDIEIIGQEINNTSIDGKKSVTEAE